jgi:anaerobic sulfite reductase subunit B
MDTQRTTTSAAVEPPAPFRVAGRKRETHDTWTLRLEPHSGERPAALPGQFTMLYAFGVGEVPISLSGDVRGPLVHTVRAVGAVTTAICNARLGASLGVRGPFGNTWPTGEAAGGDLLVVAGGIGLAPLRPVLYDVFRQREAYQEVALLYGSRTPSDLLFVRELERWRGRFDLQVDVTVDSAEAGWRGRVGVAAKLIATARFEPSTTTVFLCGPEIMMRFTALDLIDRGVRPDRIHLSMERNMRCGVGHCGHCQLGPTLICRDGPVYRYSDMRALMEVREL